MVVAASGLYLKQRQIPFVIERSQFQAHKLILKTTLWSLGLNPCTSVLSTTPVQLMAGPDYPFCLFLFCSSWPVWKWDFEQHSVYHVTTPSVWKHTQTFTPRVTSPPRPLLYEEFLGVWVILRQQIPFNSLPPHQCQLEAASPPCRSQQTPLTGSHLADFGGWWLRRWLCWCWGRLRWRLRLMLGLGLWLGLQAVSGDLVNLPRGRHVHHIICLHLDLVARRQEGVETHNQVWVALEELRYTADHSWSVNAEQGIKTERHHLPPPSPWQPKLCVRQFCFSNSILPSITYDEPMKHSKTHSYKYVTNLKNDIRILLFVQTALYRWDLATSLTIISRQASPPDSQVNQLASLSLGTAALGRNYVSINEETDISEEILRLTEQKAHSCFYTTMEVCCTGMERQSWVPALRCRAHKHAYSDSSLSGSSRMKLVTSEIWIPS